MPLVYACIAPHGDEIIPELAETRRVADLFLKTREGMLQLSAQMEKAEPDTIVIASPHNLRLWKKIAIVFSENSSGTLRTESKTPVRVEAKCDVKLAREIYSKAIQARLAVVGANYGTFEGPASDLPMDWGTVIPLHFFLKGKTTKRRIVMVAPSREIPLRENVAFGRAIADVAKSKGARIAFVASADQAHTHAKTGLYGYHPSAKIFDRLAVEAIEGNDLASLMHLDPRLIEDAKPDSIWQMAVLAGCLSKLKTRSRLISYEVPTYYGMICAEFIPI